mmetsp:Transcript_85087/g.275499  ORF Transcript_85087/g.275499 Transcript_85087/m.275499 type:complete len:219 (-) Transcript_85087:761-1417(-)
MCRWKRNMASAVLSSRSAAMRTVAAVESVRRRIPLRTSLRCRFQAFSTRERCTPVLVGSRAGELWLVKTPMSCAVLCSAEPERGSSTQTVSLKACGRRFARSSSTTMSLRERRSPWSMPRASKSASTCLRILAGESACSTSSAEAPAPSLLPVSSRKGRQETSGARSQAPRRTFTRRLICLQLFGVLSRMTRGLPSFIAWIILRLRGGCQTWGTPAKT